MKIPKKINILGFDYKVKHKATEEMKKNSWAGAVNYFNRVIHIDPSYSDISKADTLLHEIIHAIDITTSGTNDVTLTEGQVQRIATGIESVLRNNKVMEWL